MIDKKLKNICFLSIIIVFCITYSANAQIGSRSTVSGYVFDAERRPLSQLPVELLSDLNTVIQRSKTDISGRYMFRGLSGGRFSIRVLTLGTNLEEETQEIVVSDLGPFGRQIADNVQADFYLRLRKSGINPILGSGVLFVQDIPEDAKKIYSEAIEDINKNQTNAGIEKLQNAIRIFPDYYAALEKLGLEYINQQKFSEAQDIFSKAVLINSRGFSSWYGLCYANFYLQKPAEVIKAGKQAIVILPNSVEVLLMMGLAQRQLKDYVEAEKTLVQAKKFANGKNPNIHWNLALLYAHNLNRYKDAANELELFLKASPDSPDKENIKKLIKQFREKA